ncbi:hypothetical protein GCM10010430_56430 [Kitasatospora cystarginea]|uniref:Uncharacterized protein n=1 Tax=Kitasatospora cystarginea TaxID=58350 RepID=A0ABP5RNV2_9ACTN
MLPNGAVPKPMRAGRISRRFTMVFLIWIRGAWSVIGLGDAFGTTVVDHDSRPRGSQGPLGGLPKSLCCDD